MLKFSRGDVGRSGERSESVASCIGAREAEAAEPAIAAVVDASLGRQLSSSSSLPPDQLYPTVIAQLSLRASQISERNP